MKLPKGRVLFDLALVVFLGVLVVDSFSYSERARLIPLLVGIPTLFMAMVLLAADSIPAAGAKLAFVRQKGLVLDRGARKIGAEGEAPGEDTVGFTARTWRLFAWLAFLALLLRYSNYLYGVPLFILLIIKLEAKEKWSTSILTAVGVGIFNLVLFRVFLQATF